MDLANRSIFFKSKPIGARLIDFLSTFGKCLIFHTIPTNSQCVNSIPFAIKHLWPSFYAMMIENTKIDTILCVCLQNTDFINS